MLQFLKGPYLRLKPAKRFLPLRLIAFRKMDNLQRAEAARFVGTSGVHNFFSELRDLLRVAANRTDLANAMRDLAQDALPLGDAIGTARLVYGALSALAKWIADRFPSVIVQ